MSAMEYAWAPFVDEAAVSTVSVEGLRRSWIACLGEDPAGSVYVEPEVLAATGDGKAKPPLFFAGWEAGGRKDGKLRALAVLKSKSVRIPAKTWVGRMLRGYSLVGNRIAGAEGAGAIPAFVEAAIELVASGGCDFVNFDDLEVGCQLWEELWGASASGGKVMLYQPLAPQPHWWIEFPEKPEEYWGHFAAKALRNIRREARRFEHTVKCVTRAQDVEGFLEAAHSVAQATWLAKRSGMRVTNSAQERDFFTALAAKGALRSYLVEHEGTPVAFAIGVQWKGCYRYEETGYDMAHAKYSPGTIMLLRMIEDMIARDTPRLMDFGFGHAEYKRLFCTRQTQSAPVLLMPRTLRFQSLIFAQRAIHKASALGRLALQRARLLRRIRQAYRR